MNRPPIVTAQDQVALLNTSINGVNLASASDPDGDPITLYRFRDTNPANGSGRLFLNGTARAANVWVQVTAANLGNLEFRAGSVVSQDTVEVQVFDGSVWSTITSFVVYSARPNTTLPRIEGSISVVSYEKVRVMDMLNIFDPDGWPIDRLLMKDTNIHAASGYFEFKGQKMPQNEFFYVLDMKELPELYWVGALNGQTETLVIRARDGAPNVGGQWSAPAYINATTLENLSRPFVAPFSIVLPQNFTTSMESLVSVSDADGNTPKRYRFLDTSVPQNSAYISINGVRLEHGVWHEVSADQLNLVTFTTAAINRADELRVQAFDGKFWSPIQTVRVTSRELPRFKRPEIVALEEIERISVFEQLTKLDKGPIYSTYQIFDASSTNPNPLVDLTGNLVFGANNFLQTQTVHTLSRQQFSQLRFESGKWDNRQIDEIFVRAFNGEFYTPWERITIRSEPEMRDSHFTDQENPNNWMLYFPGQDKVVLTYSFAENYPQDGRPTGSADPDEFYVMATVGRQAMRDEFARWTQTFDRIDFVEVSDTTVHPEFGPHGIIRIHGYIDPEDTAAAFAFFPQDPRTGFAGGDIWLNYGNTFVDTAAAWALDGFQRMVFRHELGHALGLKHPYFTEGNPGNQNAPVLPPALGLHDYSIMYTPGSRNDGLFTRSFGLYGDATLLYLYGQGNINSGNTRYDIQNYWGGKQRFADVITDSGGIDTLAVDVSIFDNFLDLREGSFSSINGETQNVFINFGSIIENAVGGLGNDTIIGNDYDNVLVGGVGNDLLIGNGGNDILIGNSGHDIYQFTLGDGHNIIDERQGGGRDIVRFVAMPDLGFNDFSENFYFRRLNRDLVIDVRLAGEPVTQMSVRIKDQLWGGSRVETLEFNGQRIDLLDLYSKTNNVDQRFAINLTEPETTFGRLVSPI
ncbi:MAG TPA: M10 family metallopeptidase C-terminal domain-containing protein [Pirellulaceae bacterium]|nr:M10 family metallopeptidase C-terminal domain-containing protein [Pirellulaceae bacterium]HMO90961.1 M10 family metallopeptidase C-terminal domain-containing protein [Pirellulaceae bacterium]HMP69859.1 M10 family metallopeptidase C-terminal domain-containing protein [Pirellulaceae bacterium]